MLRYEQKVVFMEAVRRTILVVEDDADCMRILEQAVTEAGARPLRAYGGVDAIRKVKQYKPVLVLTDLAMPQVSGVEVIHAIKSDPETRHIPVVAVTAYIWDAIARGAGQAGCDAYLAKPFKIRELVTLVQRYLERRAA
jgi:two-component system cell cycle response regulator DivK